MRLHVMALCKGRGLPAPVFEYRFAPPRMFRFDVAWPEVKIAVEQEGGVWVGGRHVRGRGYLSDLEKYNLAVLLGWRVLRYSPDQMRKGVWLRDVEHLLRHGEGLAAS
jgi:hypothetical protein